MRSWLSTPHDPPSVAAVLPRNLRARPFTIEPAMIFEDGDEPFSGFLVPDCIGAFLVDIRQ